MSEDVKRARNIAFDAGWAAHEAFIRIELEAAIKAAYEEGWSHACADWLKQETDPTYPIGRGKTGPTGARGDHQ